MDRMREPQIRLNKKKKTFACMEAGRLINRQLMKSSGAHVAL